MFDDIHETSADETQALRGGDTVRRQNEWDSRGDYLTEALAHPG